MHNMEQNPRVTVLLSVFNDQDYIGEAIESVLGQTFKDFELLIVDDCSTDSTVEIIKGYSDPRIRLVVNDRNIDISRSLNKGLGLARGKYIARHDSDDISMPQRLERQVDFLDKNKDIAAVGARTEFIDEGGGHTGYWNQEVFPEDIFYALSYRCPLTSSSMTYDKGRIMSLGGYDESSSHAEDYELFYRVSRTYKIYVIPEYLVKYRVREEQRLSKNHGPISERSFEIASRTKMDIGLLKFLQNRHQDTSFTEKLRLLKELKRFHASIQKEGTRLGHRKTRLKTVCFKMAVFFSIKVLVGKKGKLFIKRVLRLGSNGW